MKPSAIGWADYSGGNLNFVTGCTPVSRGCANCYARRIYERFGRDHSVVRVHPDKLERLAKQRFGKSLRDRAGTVEYESPKRPGHKPMCFVVDTGDLFHEDVPDEFVLSALRTLAGCQDVTWQILTKRPRRMVGFYNAYGYQYQIGGEPNLWLGVSVEGQATADERIPLLLQTPAAVRFVSVEPMLEPVDLTAVEMPDGDTLGRNLHNWGVDAGLDWVICGAESGPNRRAFDPRWAEALYEQCACAGVPYFGKQTSGLHPGEPLLIEGRVIHEWPEAGLLCTRKEATTEQH